MAATKQPVAVRIARPFRSEDEFLAAERDTLTRTTVVLLGAQKRPEGVVLRFEVTLEGGAPLLRGEGRVVGYKEDAHRGEPGLLMRFTRLDSKSKALVDRATARKEGKRSARPPAAEPSGPAIEALASTGSLPAVDSEPSIEPAPASEAAAAPPPEAAPAPAPNPAPRPAAAPLPGDREAFLSRLRERAKGLDPARIQAILKARAP